MQPIVACIWIEISLRTATGMTTARLKQSFNSTIVTIKIDNEFMHTKSGARLGFKKENQQIINITINHQSHAISILFQMHLYPLLTRIVLVILTTMTCSSLIMTLKRIIYFGYGIVS